MPSSTRWNGVRGDGGDGVMRFVPVDAGTRVTLEHRGLDRLPPDVAAQRRRFGWITLLGWFDEHFAATPEAAP